MRQEKNEKGWKETSTHILGLALPSPRKGWQRKERTMLIKSASDNQPWPHSFEATQLFTEEGMATHSSILAWRIPWTEEPGGLQPVGSQRVRHD